MTGKDDQFEVTMKTKDFIKLLQEADPTGECHMMMEGGDVEKVERYPWFYDGRCTILERNDEGIIKGIRKAISEDGDKIVIYTINVTDLAYRKAEWDSYPRSSPIEKYMNQVYDLDIDEKLQEKFDEKYQQGLSIYKHFEQ